MWHPDVKYSNQPRFRMNIIVRDEMTNATFTLFDEQVNKLAFETCGVLRSIGESCSMYPNELDVLYGDAMLLKVTKKVVDVANVSKLYEIVDMLTDPLILDKFFECYMPSYGPFDCLGGKRSSNEVYDACSSTESENWIEESS
ncbi:hypothetical protein TSUD_63640 [Trifolium subterraneum]|uniref:Replication factor A C-terminal domain-containing protein n=1 Tax=Trifolium subterraneum TaxID=3900 RepID=A0A2Z6N6T6_TRISU|nr:hypothetical protein TSUD_63640 [Trifolium subterraneum]